MDREMIGIIICAALVPILIILYFIGDKIEKEKAKIKMEARRKKTDNSTVIVELRMTDIPTLLKPEMFDEKSWNIIQKAPIERLIFKRMDAVDGSVE